jgi:sugar lactone lactonase YvrE/4-amino-4-deoxy-L-arabinose transferase-like glycosyltransferase
VGLIATGDNDTQVSSPARAASWPRGLDRLWQARGWWGGLIALGLAARGQDILINANDPATAGTYYLLAVVLLIAVWLHPARPRRRAADTPPPDPASSETPAATLTPASDQPAVSVANASVSAPAEHITSTLPTRRVRSAPAEPVPVPVMVPEPAPVAPVAVQPQLSPWARWKALRARLGWRLTAAGLVLTGVLAGAATLVLQRDIADPLGGWLWAAALAVLVLTFVGTEPWPRGAGLPPGPADDFFARGLPRLSIPMEAVLIGGILLGALALRLVNLEYMPGIFGDEGERGMDARAIVEGRPALIFGYGWWGVPNLYFYCVAWMLRLFGDNMVGDRMLSVISGVLAVWFVYRIGRMLWGPRAGLIAGALLAVSPLALQFSRLAGESTPTGTLWAAGFFFLFRALRDRRPLDWVWAGIWSGFSLYFYAAGKLIIPLLAAVGLYCLVRWRLDFFRRYALGFVLLGLAFGLTFLPYALFSIKDHWQGFTGRAQETSIFSPQNQPQAFSQYGIPYDPAQAGQPLLQNVLTHPLPWARVVAEQLRVTTEVIYKRGDPTPFYQIHDHAGSMLPPLWAAIALLGLAYAAWKAWDGRFGLVSIWFWGGMLGAALTMDTPSVQRLTGAWPVLMLFPAVVLDRVWAAAWPLSQALARRWATVPLAALLVFFGGTGYQEYFVHYASLCPYCSSTLQARYAQALGQDYKGYQMGVGGYDVFFTYGSTRFAAKGVEGVDLAVPADFFPITDNHGKGAAFLVYGPNADYLPLIRLFYPGGAEEPVKGVDGVTYFTSYKITARQMAAFQTLQATYTPATGAAVTRDEPNLGTTRGAGAPDAWTPPAGLTYPAQAAWQGDLVAPNYGLYTFSLTGAGRLEIDGAVVLDATAPAGQPDGAARQVDRVLAKGSHTVRLSGVLANAQTRLDVLWAPGGTVPAPIAAAYLYHGPSGGLSGEVRPYAPGIPLTDAAAISAAAVSSRRSDPFFGFREATVAFKQAPFVVRWQGTLTATTAGAYAFDLSSNGPSLLLIDGQAIVNNAAQGTITPAQGTVNLTAGAHQVDLRYAWQGGPARLEWYWTPPGGERALVPPAVLAPAARSWAAGALPDAPGAVPLPEQAAAAPNVVPPAAVLGQDAGLKEPRGVAVDAQGQVYIADSGNHRVVRLDAAGKVNGGWGSATTTSAPGKFGLIADLAVGPDGHVATLDVTTGDVQLFGPDGQVLVQLPGLSPNASGIALGPDGQIWVADTSRGRVLRFTPTGQPDGVFTGESAGHKHFDQPIDVAPAAGGTAYVVDLSGRVVQLDPAGKIVREWLVPAGGGRGGSHLTIWHDLVVLTDPDRQRLTILDPAAGSIRYLGSEGTRPGQFRVPLGIAGGATGPLYVTDSDNARIQVFDSLDAK